LAEKEITIEIKNPWLILTILILLIVLSLELKAMLITPINFGDEGFHARAAQLIAEKVEYFVWIPFGAETSKGWFGVPLWHLTSAGFFLILRNVDLVAKILPPFIAFIASLAVFILSKKLYNEKVAFLSTIIFVTLPAFVTYSVLFYRDVLFVLYLTLFFLTFLLHFKTKEKKYWILAGVFSFLAFLTKTPGVIVYPFVILAFLYQLLIEKSNFLPLLKKYSVFILFLLILPSTFFLRNLYYHKTPLCGLPFFDGKCAINTFNPKYEFTGRVEPIGTEVGLLQFGFKNYLEFAYGPIWFVSLAFLCGLYSIFMKRSNVETILFLILLMLLPILYKSTWRTEDTARYTLGWAPIIAIVAANWFDQIYEFLKKYYKYFGTVVIIFVLLMSWINFKGKLDIMQQVKRFSPLYFEACEWVKKNLPENVTLMTIWSNRAVYNTQRNCAGNVADIVLSRDVNYTLSVAKQLGITHLFIQKFSIDFRNQHLSERYDWDFVQFLESHPEHFKNIYENGPSLQQCLQAGGCDGNIIYEIVF